MHAKRKNELKHLGPLSSLRMSVNFPHGRQRRLNSGFLFTFCLFVSCASLTVPSKGLKLEVESSWILPSDQVASQFLCAKDFISI